MNTDSRFTHYSLVRSLPVGLITLLLAILLGLAQPLLVRAATPDRRFGAIDRFDNPAAATQLGAGRDSGKGDWGPKGGRR